MVARARQLTRAEGLGNVSFVAADAQVHPLDPGAHDVVVSRFGASFFDDLAAAFARLGAALRPGGRLALVTWRHPAENAWQRELVAALAPDRSLPPPGVPGPFGLADPGRTRAVLAAAGFVDVEIVPVDRPFDLGADSAAAFAFLLGTGIVRGLTGGLDEPVRAEALGALRDMLDAHDGPDGVRLGSAAWLVRARRPR